MEMSMNSMGLTLHTIKERLPATINLLSITPSAAPANKSYEFSQVLNYLHTTVEQPSLEVLEATGGDFAGFCWAWTWSRGQDESDSCEPFCNAFNALYGGKYTATNIANGQELMTGQLLFDVQLHSIRKYDPVTRRKIAPVILRAHVHGRIDIVISEGSVGLFGISRNEVIIGIQVTQESCSSYESSCRKAVVQLIGLCGDNLNRTPSVILTDFTTLFHVFYLRSDGARHSKYSIGIQQCSSIAAALYFAHLRVSTGGICRDYGRCNTLLVSEVEDSSD